MTGNYCIHYRLGLVIISLLIAITATGLWIFSTKADTPIYVQPLGNDIECNGATPDAYPGGPGPQDCAVKTIQRGIDLVDAGGTVSVSVGNYTETVIISKSMNLLGAQVGITPLDASIRVGGESIIRPPTSRPTDTHLIMVVTDDVTINGFMLDGNNPDLDMTECTNISNGVCLHTSGAIANGTIGAYSNPINRLVVAYNIIKNHNFHGVAIDSDAAVPTANNLVVANVFDNMSDGAGAPAGRRSGIWVSKNQYTDITGNRLTRVQDGIRVSTFGLPNPDTTAIISGNQVACNFHCIDLFGFFGTSSTYKPISNTISGGRIGLRLHVITNTLTITASNNTISGTLTGIYVNRDTQAILSGNSVNNNTTGVKVDGSARLVSATNNFITNNTSSGIQVATNPTYGDGIVSSIFDNNLSGNASGVTNDTSATIDASGNWWGDPAVPISATVDYTPWLDAGIDSGSEQGFQGDFSSISADDDSPQTGVDGRITEGISLVDTFGTLHILAGAYTENVNLNKNATVQSGGDLALVGDLTIQDGTFVAPDGSMSIAGDFSLQGGGFTHNGGTLTFSGSGPQSIGGATSAIFNNLAIDNSDGVNLGFNHKVNGALTLSDGLFTLGSSDLTLGPAASVSGSFSASNMVVADGSGRLCKQFDSPGSFSYPVGDHTGAAEYSPGSISFTTGTFNPGAQACVNLTDQVHPSITTDDYITRYWTVSSSNITNFSADVYFEYRDTDIVGTENLLYAAKFDGAELTYGDAVNTSNNRLSMSGIDTFSDFTASERTTSITVIKATDPASVQSFSFSGDLGSFNLINGNSEYVDDLLAGDYTITESVPTGWELADVNCIGGDSTPTLNGVTVSLALGDNVICTFTNHQLGSINIAKATVPASGQSFDFGGDLGSFSLTNGNSQSFPDLSAGVYNITESVPSGWYLDEAACTGGDSTPVTNGVAVSLDPGEHITCTFTNHQPGSITVIKDTIPDSSAIFGFSGDLGTFNLDDGESRDFNNLVADDYAIVESPAAGWYLDDVDCQGGDYTQDASGATVSLDPGEDITCTFTNRQTGSITISKVSNPAGGTGFQFEGDLGGFTLNHGGSRAFDELIPGTYLVSESPSIHWILDNISCTGEITPVHFGVSIQIDHGEAITCTFENIQATPFFLPLIMR